MGIARLIIQCFSKANNRKRNSPAPSSKTHHLRLITVAGSHFCEKARWGLDLLEDDLKSPFYYTEDGHAPPFVSFETLPASNNVASASPMLVDDDSNSDSYIVKSDAILRKYCSFLYPPSIRDQVEALEDDLGMRVGSTVRCIVYHHLLRPEYSTVVCDVMARGIPTIESTLFQVLFDRGISDAMRKFMKINSDTCEASIATLRTTFAELSTTLEDGAEYLCDDDKNGVNGATTTTSHGFTAADLSLAALSAPLLQPDGYCRTFGVDSTRLPPELVALQNELRNTAAGRHVFRMYEQHRPLVEGAVVLKNVL